MDMTSLIVVAVCFVGLVFAAIFEGARSRKNKIEE